MMHWRYLKYVVAHKWFVLLAGLKTGAPLWRLVIHDWSKFTLAEWTPYARRFYGGRSNEMDKTLDPNEFKQAWTHHWHHNPHHPEYWLAINGWDTSPLRMPDHFVKEMVADWMGAGRAKTGSWDMSGWFDSNRDRLPIHSDNWPLVEALINEHGRDR